MSDLDSNSGSPQLRPKKSLASRFGSLFGPKAGHINECYVELDEHSRVYNPGDILKGTVVLDVAKPLGVTHIAVSLFGYLEVFKNHSRQRTEHRDNVARVTSGKGKRWVSEYYGDGFASLFEDEVVLCGQGRLDPKLYHFRFELTFPAQLKLPSSIWFERGTVRYVVSTTITRPAAMNPTTTFSRKVEFKESIDVAGLPPPKPRFVTLERVERSNRSRVVRPLASEASSICPPSPTSSRGEVSSQTTATCRNRSSSRAPTPTSPSMRSSLSMPSSHARDSVVPADSRSSRTSNSNRIDASISLGSARESSRNITASVQLSRAGCLPGETMNVAVNVKHTKLVRSVRGVIVTLYRTARVDLHPNLPVVDGTSGKLQKYEDYYPRSKTGLGGLSLSAAGSGQVWRKDLCQAFAPLLINPATMSTVVKAAIRVPDDSFPTFRNAPGDMISFRYFVEVVVDIHGKLARQPSLSEDVDIPTSQTSMPGLEETAVLDEHHQIPKWTTNCIDTAPMRRDKNAISIVCEVIVGTKDTAKRSRDKSRRKDSNGQTSTLNGSFTTVAQTPRSDGYEQYSRNRPAYTDRHYSEPLHTDGHPPYESGSRYEYSGYDGDYDYSSESAYWQYHQGQGQGPGPGPWMDYMPEPAWQPPPIPQPAFEEGLSEKERLKRMEESLLPSAPPVANGAGSVDNTPSAPYIPDENEFEDAQAYRDAVSSQPHAPSSSRIPAHSPAHDFLADVPSQPVPTYTPSSTDQMQQEGPALAEPAASIQEGTSDESLSATDVNRHQQNDDQSRSNTTRPNGEPRSSVGKDVVVNGTPAGEEPDADPAVLAASSSGNEGAPAAANIRTQQ